MFDYFARMQLSTLVDPKAMDGKTDLVFALPSSPNEWTKRGLTQSKKRKRKREKEKKRKRKKEKKKKRKKKGL